MVTHVGRGAAASSDRLGVRVRPPRAASIRSAGPRRPAHGDRGRRIRRLADRGTLMYAAASRRSHDVSRSQGLARLAHQQDATGQSLPAPASRSVSGRRSAPSRGRARSTPSRPATCMNSTSSSAISPKEHPQSRCARRRSRRAAGRWTRCVARRCGWRRCARAAARARRRRPRREEERERAAGRGTRAELGNSEARVRTSGRHRRRTPRPRMRRPAGSPRRCR